MFDVLTVAAVADELNETILDGRIQKLGLVNPTTVAAEVYAKGRRRALVASADADDPAIWLAGRLPSTDPSLITPFGLQLRKYVRGGFLIGIEQPAMERIVRLSIVKRLTSHNDSRATEPDDEEDEPEDGDDADIWGPDMNRVNLVVEIMGRHSNLILVDANGTIMESAKRVTSKMSRVRPILPRMTYEAPPVPDKPDPRRLTSASVESLLGAAKPSATVSDTLVRGLRGVSPQIGREVAFRLTGDATVKVADLDAATTDLAREVRNVFEPLLTRTWAPEVYEQEDLPIAYAATPMAHLAAIAEAKPIASISEAVDAMRESEGDSGPRDHAQRRARVIAAIETLRQEFDEHTGGRQPVGERAGNRSKKQAPRRVTGLTDAAGNLIYIGRSGRENDQVTFDIGGNEDTWLHARGVPGSHVIIRWLRPAEQEDENAVETAAALAAHYSGSRGAGTVEVDVTRRKNVRKIKGGGPGMVTYRNEHTIAVRPQDEASLKADGRLA